VFDIKETGVTIKNTSNSRYGLINPSLITDYRNHLLPDKSGTFALTSDLRPYKVFTALLTQSGGDTEDTISSGLLTIGVTYHINTDSPGMNFTNVGAPNNNVGTAFIATGTTPASWGSGGSLTLAYSAGAPVATVLENTIGDLWITYSNPGEYYINSNSLFTQDKVFTVVTNNVDLYDAGIFMTITLNPESDSLIFIRTGNVDDHYNDVLNNTPIEIRVYND
jgi:hypothetical protein